MTVLLVDDNSEILSMLTEHLAFEGIVAVTASSAAEALRLHWDQHFAVILTDISMPGMNGVDLIREVKKAHPTCIAFVMTGFASTANLVECIEAGAVDYFVKPLDMPSVLSSLKDALERHERWKRELGNLARPRGN